MSDVRITATASLSTLNRWIQTIAGNLTGAQIYGYKGTRLSFGDALVDSIRDGARSGALGGANAIQVPAGSITIGATSTDFRQGAIVSTGNDHHLAIDGNGWFAVTNPAGQITYTRNGEFHVDDSGNLVDAMGNFVLGVFDQSKGLVLNDGKSFVKPGQLPVLAVGTASLAKVQIGMGNGMGQIPVAWPDIDSVTAYGKTVATGNITSIAMGISNPADIAIDGDGNLLVASYGGHLIRVIPAVSGTYYGQAMTVGTVYTIAGLTTGSTADNIPATAAKLNQPLGMEVDKQGNVIFADRGSHRVRFIPRTSGTYFGQTMQAGRVYTIAGTGSAGNDKNLLGTAARINAPFDVTTDANGNILFADSSNNRLCVVAAQNGTFYGQAMTAGHLYTIAGGGAGGSGSVATNASLLAPIGVDIDGAGNVLISSSTGNCIQVLANANGTFYGRNMQAGRLYTIAGTGVSAYNGDTQQALSTNIGNPHGIKLDPFGHVAIADRANNRIRLLATRDGYFYGQQMKAGHVYTIAGSGAPGAGGDGGPALGAAFNNVTGISFDGLGNLLISDLGNNRVRMVPPGHGQSAHGLYTFLDQPEVGYQDRNLAIQYVGAGPIRILGAMTGTDLPFFTLRSVNGSETPITITLSATNNKPTNTAYDNARLIADAINAKSNLTGVGVSIVRDRKDPNGKVALVMGHINRTLAEDFIDFTDPYNPEADLARTGAGLTKVTIDAQGNVFHTVNVKTLTASAPGYRPESGDKVGFDATGQMINLSRGAEPGAAPPFATGVHVALIKPSNANGLEKTAGSSRFTYTDAAGRLLVGYAGQTKTSQIDHRFGFQIVGSSTIGAENRLTPQALEAANTSITDQLPELTIAQKVFTSTSKLVSVGNTIVDDLNGLIR